MQSLLTLRLNWRTFPVCSILKSECPDVWKRLPRQKWPKSWANMEDPVVHLERNLYGHPFGRIVVGNTFRGSFIGPYMGESTKSAMRVRSSKTGVISVNLRGWHQNGWMERGRIWLPCGRSCSKKKKVDIGKPTSFLDEWKSNEKIIEISFWITYSYWSTEKLPGWEKHPAETVAWSYDMEGHAQKCVERFCELANKKLAQLYKVSSLCLDDHQFKQEELETVEERSEVCPQIVLVLALDTNWTIWHSTVGQQACKIRHKMDSSMSKTTSKPDFLHSSHKWIPTILSCGKHGTALLIGFMSRLRLCWRPWGLEINTKRSLMNLWE